MLDRPAVITGYGLVVDGGPVLRLALPPLFSFHLLIQDLDSIDVLLNFMRTMIQMVIVVIENVKDLASVFGPVRVMEVLERLNMKVLCFRLRLLK